MKYTALVLIIALTVGCVSRGYIKELTSLQSEQQLLEDRLTHYEGYQREIASWAPRSADLPEGMLSRIETSEMRRVYQARTSDTNRLAQVRSRIAEIQKLVKKLEQTPARDSVKAADGLYGTHEE